jgi:4-hydroxy-3-polyprenylbenzoate decarboxylase
LENFGEFLRTIVILTGASGSVFGVECLRRLPHQRYAVLTKWGKVVLKEETGLGTKDLEGIADAVFSDEDLASPLSSGSNFFDAVIVLPASANFLAKVAAGIGDTLGTRICHIALKEKRRLVMCLRESPITAIALDNAARIVREGAIVMPVSPFFYTKPDSLEAMIRDFVDRVIQAATGKPFEPGWKHQDLP